IAYRLVRASNERPNVDFSREALQMIYQRSGGIPRVVNLVCDNALLVGYSRNTRLIDSSVVKRAVEQMMPNFNNEIFEIDGDDAASMDAAAPAGEELDDGRRL